VLSQIKLVNNSACQTSPRSPFRGSPSTFDRRGARAVGLAARPPARFSSLRNPQTVNQKQEPPGNTLLAQRYPCSGNSYFWRTAGRDKAAQTFHSAANANRRAPGFSTLFTTTYARLAGWKACDTAGKNACATTHVAQAFQSDFPVCRIGEHSSRRASLTCLGPEPSWSHKSCPSLQARRRIVSLGTSWFVAVGGKVWLVSQRAGGRLIKPSSDLH
jgi:hypothetical protein